jgi:predicted RNA-binding Zn ribbon-like protein
MSKASRGRSGRAFAPAPETVGQLELVRPPAPGGLELVRDLLNTLDLDRGTDALATAEGLNRWLSDHDPIGSRDEPAATDADAARVREIREDLRAMARRNNGVACDCATGILEDASTRARFALTFDANLGSALLRPTAPGLDGALGRVLAAVHQATIDGTWCRLKACADPTCAWAYYDRSKNGCSRWCGDTCLNRSKVKRFRERRSTEAATVTG